MEQLAQFLAELLTRVPTRTDLAGITRLLVLQATTFCNIDCEYCYLPNRNQRRKMSHDTVAAAVSWVFREGLAARDLTLVWHAGEPLTLPPAWYRKAFDVATGALPAGATLRYCLQTNAMLINEAWCDVFEDYDVQVGVSIDGPAALHDARRKTRAGSGTFAGVSRGIGFLRRRKIPFHAICVVTEASLDQPEALVDFFAEQGILELGLNIEEIEGVNTRSTLDTVDGRERFRAFFERLMDRAAVAGLNLREVRNIVAALPRRPEALWPGNDQNTPFAIVTVTCDGEIHTFSPELAGLSHPRLGSMALGNVAVTSLDWVLASPRFQALWTEVAAGVAACRKECAYFSLCRGGAPSNKLAERDTFATTETMACRLGHQEIAETVLTRLLYATSRSTAAPDVTV